jgi:hypothetical protein
MSAGARHAQAWIEPFSDDPEAVSALAIARERLAAGRTLRGLRRITLFELCGPLGEPSELETLLHRSKQFYNPNKQRCTVRANRQAVSIVRPDERLLLVVDRDGGRRGPAERWWRHETLAEVEVREAVVWAMEFAGEADGLVEELAVLRNRRHGLFCNPHAQRYAVSGAEPPLPWIKVGPRGDAA